ncbi:hypothetical protein M011DRAFT_469089 [Sporormia fimetaria CBS 119925]|uniref:Uncharacterized protein n=1 Tax=Sporormia fimetaria CBS 119925 TaxID=1340428 RepID=A0A6A6V8G7_9PLEO|nr:hypothetical protein M011DRAFT_469089 [Sporormia fimetaria CBS 119925]
MHVQEPGQYKTNDKTSRLNTHTVQHTTKPAFSIYNPLSALPAPYLHPNQQKHSKHPPPPCTHGDCKSSKEPASQPAPIRAPLSN